MAIGDSIVKCPTGTRTAIFGPTGCGKTTLAHEMVRQDRNRFLVVIDPKGNFNQNVNGKPLRRYSRPFKGSGIFTPKPEQFDDVELYNELLRTVFNQKDTTVFIDELIPLLGPNRSTHPRYLQMGYQLGRQKNITFITCSQRPACIPVFIFTESNRLAVFRLTGSDDIRRINQTVRTYDDLVDGLRRFEFVFFGTDGGNQKPIVATIKQGEKS